MHAHAYMWACTSCMLISTHAAPYMSNVWQANLSCNFFRATFDIDEYCKFVESVLGFLESK